MFVTKLDYLKQKKKIKDSHAVDRKKNTYLYVKINDFELSNIV